METAIAYNVITLEILATFVGENVGQLIDAQNYDYDVVGITYGTDFGLVYTDASAEITEAKA